MTDAADPKRRRTLVVLASATGCAALGLVAAPTLAFVANRPQTRAEAARFRRLDIGLGDLEAGKPRRVRVEGEVPALVWLVRTGNEVRAFAARCPHLGCSVGVAEDHLSFECPCHHARFALSGARLEHKQNPAPRDLDPLETRIDPGTS